MKLNINTSKWTIKFLIAIFLAFVAMQVLAVIGIWAIPSNTLQVGEATIDPWTVLFLSPFVVSLLSSFFIYRDKDYIERIAMSGVLFVIIGTIMLFSFALFIPITSFMVRNGISAFVEIEILLAIFAITSAKVWKISKKLRDIILVCIFFMILITSLAVVRGIHLKNKYGDDAETTIFDGIIFTSYE